MRTVSKSDSGNVNKCRNQIDIASRLQVDYKVEVVVKIGVHRQSNKIYYSVDYIIIG